MACENSVECGDGTGRPSYGAHTRQMGVAAMIGFAA